jgi:hypothetical protein
MRNKIIFYILFLLCSKSYSIPLMLSENVDNKKPVNEFTKKFSVQVGREIRYDRDSNLEFYDRSPLVLSSFYFWSPNLTLGLELSRSESQSGNLSLNYKKEQFDLVPWLHWNLYSDLKMHPYFGLSVGGLHQETIETQLYGKSSRSKGKPFFLYGTSFGLKFYGEEKIFVGGEVRMLSISGQKEVWPGGLLTIGYFFR